MARLSFWKGGNTRQVLKAKPAELNLESAGAHIGEFGNDLLTFRVPQAVRIPKRYERTHYVAENIRERFFYPTISMKINVLLDLPTMLLRMRALA
jgi:hypothetical protein